MHLPRGPITKFLIPSQMPQNVFCGVLEASPAQETIDEHNLKLPQKQHNAEIVELDSAAAAHSDDQIDW